MLLLNFATFVCYWDVGPIYYLAAELIIFFAVLLLLQAGLHHCPRRLGCRRGGRQRGRAALSFQRQQPLPLPLHVPFVHFTARKKLGEKLLSSSNDTSPTSTRGCCDGNIDTRLWQRRRRHRHEAAAATTSTQRRRSFCKIT